MFHVEHAGSTPAASTTPFVWIYSRGMGLFRFIPRLDAQRQTPCNAHEIRFSTDELWYRLWSRKGDAMLDQFLLTRPGDLTPLGGALLIGLGIAALALCIWGQMAWGRFIDRRWRK
jgi:hypothetical protein